jgi:putative transposase
MEKPLMDILALFQCLRPHVTVTTLRPFHRVAFALLVRTGRVTMLGLSRWAGPGGSYRTVQRFFSTVLPWATLFWVFFRQHLYRPGDVYLLAGDEVVVTKAGQHTHGLDRFLASLYGKPVPGLAFFTLSLVSTQERRAFPVHVEQVGRSDAEKAVSQAKAAAKPQKPSSGQRRRGRPKGSKNENTADVTLTPELGQIKSMITALLQRVAAAISVTYVVLDGHFGNHHAVHMARQCHVHRISKRRSESALYLPYTGLYAGRGPHRLYGSKLDYRSIPEKYLKATTVDGHLQTRIYQIQLLHKAFSQALHVVIIVKMNLQTHAWAHAILFSSDLSLPDDLLRDYYCLRFQIEFNVRDAKQYWAWKTS